MRADDIDEMRRLPLFNGVNQTLAESMLKVAYLQRFPAYVELVREGEPADFLHVIVDGHVEVFSAYRDRETTVAVLGPGHSFIVAAVILDRIYLKSARALTPAKVLLIPAEAVRETFAQDAGFARAMAVELATAYRAVVKELKNQKLRSSLERLANWLLVQDAATELRAPRTALRQEGFGLASWHGSGGFVALVCCPSALRRHGQRWHNNAGRSRRPEQTCASNRDDR